MGGVLANAACLHSKLLQNPTIKVVYNIFSDLHTDNDLSCLTGLIIYASGGSVTKRNRTKSSAVNKAIRFRSH